MSLSTWHIIPCSHTKQYSLLLLTLSQIVWHTLLTSKHEYHEQLVYIANSIISLINYSQVIILFLFSFLLYGALSRAPHQGPVHITIQDSPLYQTSPYSLRSATHGSWISPEHTSIHDPLTYLYKWQIFLRA